MLAAGGGSFGQSGQVKLFELPSGRERLTLRVYTNTVTALTFSSDGKTLIAGSGISTSVLARQRNGAVHRWEVSTGRPLDPGR